MPLTAYRTATARGTIEYVGRSDSPGAATARDLGWDKGDVSAIPVIWQGIMVAMTRAEKEADKARHAHERPATDLERPGDPPILDRAKPKPRDTKAARKLTRAERDARSWSFYISVLASGSLAKRCENAGAPGHRELRIGGR